MSTSETAMVVIGLGNPLMGDDGLGLAVLARLESEWVLPAGVEAVDGGTWGMNLLPVIEDAGQLLLIDAVDVAAAPGTLVTIPRERLPRYLATKISPHQVDLRDVLALAELRRTLPADTVTIGLQPEMVELSHGLSPVIEAGLDGLLTAVVQHLADRGYVCRRRAAVAHA